MTLRTKSVAEEMSLYEDVVKSINEITRKAIEHIEAVNTDDCWFDEYSDSECPEFAEDLNQEFYEDDFCPDDFMDAEFTLKIGNVLFEGTITTLDDEDEDEEDDEDEQGYCDL